MRKGRAHTLTMYRYRLLAVALAGLAFPAQAQVARVHDGDTLSIGFTRYRLAGVDAPELSEPFGRASRDMLISIIAGAPVTCAPTGAKSYDRLVARCSTRARPDLGAELIARGFALDCARYSSGIYRHLEPPGARRYLPAKPYCDIN